MKSWLQSIPRNASSDQHQPSQHHITHSGTRQPTPDQATLFQSFEWHTPSNTPNPHETHSPHSHYARLIRLLPSLAHLGITSIWLPPGCKANSPQGNGYDCYDLWDLGEFDQKWTRSTKWGSREELHELLTTAHGLDVECIFDAVLNHKTAGDATDEAWAVEVDAQDRRVEICSPKMIQAWLRYDFPGREREGMKYSKLKWDARCFNGTDWDQRGNKNAIYKLIDDPATYPKPSRQQQQQPVPVNGGMNRLVRFTDKLTGASVPVRRPGKGWAEDVDDLHGNFDYLLFSNIDYTNPDVRQDVLNWGEWMVRDVGLDGFRLDAVQHYSAAFCREWISRIQAASVAKRGKPALVVGEAWTGEVKRILRWLDAVGQHVYAYDSCLLYNFSRISEDVRRESKNADLRTILRDCLTAMRPSQSVTFVTNHDTQIGQTSFTPMLPELKLLFYAFILLRAEGLPCVFWGDLYGTQGKYAEAPACLAEHGKRSLLADLIMCRRLFAYGPQIDHFNAMSCIGWTRVGTWDLPGCAVVMSIGDKSSIKGMPIGASGEVWVDVLGEEGRREEVRIDEKGIGRFGCRGRSVSVYVNKRELSSEVLPTGFAVGDVYG